MKKLKTTYWLLGFGCGIILSGIVGTVCSLNIRVETSGMNNSELASDIKVQNEDEKKLIKYDAEEEYKTEKYKEENIKSDEELLVVDEINDGSEVINTILVHIPSQSGATDIARILEEADIIDDAKAFISFIKDQNKATKLKHGEIMFTKKLTYEQVLEILTYN